MNTRLYVGSLPYAATELDLKEIFEAYGRVVYVRILKNSETQLSRGFGFVEMSTTEEAQNAISSLDGREVDGRQIKVNEARPKEKREEYSNGGFRSSFSGGQRRGGSSY